VRRREDISRQAVSRGIALTKPRAVLLAYNQINPDLDRQEFPLYDPEDLIEYSGRWDYGTKSLTKMGDRGIITRWMKQGEESMIEMGDATFFIVCSRVVSHELVRHRLASYQQESQRFVDYAAESIDDLFVIDPSLSTNEDVEYLMDESLATYNKLRESGVNKQLARYVLTNATRTRIIMKTNFREWRHVLKLRMHTSAQPEMRVVANLIHDQLVEKFPIIFSDIKPALEAGERAAR
jgi:thymidylate synthase (FAD)